MMEEDVGSTSELLLLSFALASPVGLTGIATDAGHTNGPLAPAPPSSGFDRLSSDSFSFLVPGTQQKWSKWSYPPVPAHVLQHRECSQLQSAMSIKNRKLGKWGEELQPGARIRCFACLKTKTNVLLRLQL